ncbi:hypothetical protein WA026_011433 [Henosepilachna vigintioctopunctata]|uniref:Methionine--tRNA ligase, cytoplasmic n=1 Tax=Henosepilachna vigintioctopunctata TaxID=420089 RepID=A0AAW1TJJ9_9CUCU
MMISIYSNENNPLAFKLISGAIFSKKEVKIDTVNLNDKNVEQPRHLPYLVIEEELIFTSNAGLLYLMPTPENVKLKVNEWLEWEALVLSPCLALLIGNSSKDKALKEKLMSCLKKLNFSLTGRKFLVDDVLSPSDVCIWSVLYPFIKNESISKEYMNDFTELLKWFRNIEELPFVTEAIKKYPLTPDQVPYQILFNSSKYISDLSSDSPKISNTTLDQTRDNVTSEELLDAENSWKKGVPLTKDLNESKNPILPKTDKKNILITSALPYVNNVPHLGNIIGCVLSADVFARFSRLCNHNVLYICGTDEYGTATETKALEEGLTCQEICDKYFKIHDAIYKWFNISFNHFGRTSTPEQTELCQDLFLQLNQNGFMFTENVEQLHCEKCDRFLADRFVEGGCPNIGCTYEDARGDQCDGCGKLVNAVELKIPAVRFVEVHQKLKYQPNFSWTCQN